MGTWGFSFDLRNNHHSFTMKTFISLTCLSLVACSPGGGYHSRGGYTRTAAAPTKNIAELAIATPQLSTLLAAVKAAGLVDALAGEGPFTVFAPTNDAFAKIPSDTLNGLLADKDALTAVLLRHVVPETIFQKGICWETHQTAGGDEIATQVFKNNVAKVVSYANGVRAGVRLSDYDILATNGVIHAIDNVI